MSFSFEKLEVYQKSLDWVEKIEGLCHDLKGQVSYSFIDQLSRASLSIPLNIAEGNGRWHKGEKRQFFGLLVVHFLNVYQFCRFYTLKSLLVRRAMQAIMNILILWEKC